MSRVAFATGGILRQARGHEQVQGFIDWLQSVFEAAETTEGFIDRSRREKEWGDRVDPHFFDKNKHGFVAPTLSVLVDLLSAYAFAYNGRHAEALSHRKDWFSMLYWPAYVVWWVSDDHGPTWEEAWERLEYLNDNGLSPYAFDYSQTIDDDGQAVQLRRNIIQDRAKSILS